ncbi:hypothetical protein ACFO3D_09890 [Virgibacillus kekensis]|uniref:Oxidoreductase FAD/NAD(P)-binding domain-containing protein n=1 Tax=Virgibacillus kekensis TaxID=202261 RepID=A0ABV9DJK7_9BACI
MLHEKHVSSYTQARLHSVRHPDDTRPLVLISGGVGLTPMASMLESTVKNQPEREVYYIHAAQNGNVHAMRTTVQDIADRFSNVYTYTVYDNPTIQDQGAYDKKGTLITSGYLNFFQRPMLPFTFANQKVSCVLFIKA